MKSFQKLISEKTAKHPTDDLELLMIYDNVRHLKSDNITAHIFLSLEMTLRKKTRSGVFLLREYFNEMLMRKRLDEITK